MSFIEFNSQHITGYHEIDKYHKRIFNFVNSLFELNKLRASTNLKEKVEDLLNYIYSHFEFEEKLMKELGEVDFTHHYFEHNRFKEEVNKIINTCKDSEYCLIFELCKFIKNFFYEHIIYYDKKLANYLKKGNI